MSEDADAAAADLLVEKQEQEAEEREASFNQFHEQFVLKILNRIKANAMADFFDKWIDMCQDAKKERGAFLYYK